MTSLLWSRMTHWSHADARKAHTSVPSKWECFVPPTPFFLPMSRCAFTSNRQIPVTFHRRMRRSNLKPLHSFLFPPIHIFTPLWAGQIRSCLNQAILCLLTRKFHPLSEAISFSWSNRGNLGNSQKWYFPYTGTNREVNEKRRAGSVFFGSLKNKTLLKTPQV